MAEQTPSPNPDERPEHDDAATPLTGTDQDSDNAAGTDEPTPEEALESAARAADDIKRETSDSNVASGDAADGQPLNLEHFSAAANGEAEQAAGLNLLNDIGLQVTVELGRTRMYIEDVLRLNENSVVELDKAAGDSVDIFVNDRLVARGEVLVLNENFCVRINEIISEHALKEAEEQHVNATE